MSIEEIIRIVSLSCSLLVSVVGFAITLYKYIKTAIETGKWDKLETALKEFIENVECLTNLTGEEKKEIVLAKASNFCQTIGLKFDVVKVSTTIEDLISLSKKVNQREKDKNIGQTEPQTITDKKEGE